MKYNDAFGNHNYFKIYFITIFIILAGGLYTLNSQALMPSKVIFMNPDAGMDDAINKQIVNETVAVLEKLDINIDIIFLKERYWKKYENLISNIYNADNLSKFFVYTDVTGVVSLALEDKYDKIIVNVSLFNVYKNELNIQSYTINKISMLDDLSGYITFVEKHVLNYFPRITVKDLKKTKIKKRIKNRRYPFYEVALGGGLGFFSREIVNSEGYSFGFSTIFNFGLKAKDFGLDLGIIFSPVFNDPPIAGNTFLYNLRASLDFGRWLPDHTVRAGVGVTVATGTFYDYESYYTSESGEYDYYSTNITYLFLYLNFVFMPIHSFNVMFDFGSYFSTTNIVKYHALLYFPFYIKLGFRYVFYKNLFFDIYFPFYVYARQTSTELTDQQPLFENSINICFGRRFEWDKKK